jgi:hypothetical protein
MRREDQAQLNVGYLSCEHFRAMVVKLLLTFEKVHSCYFCSFMLFY